LEPVQVRERFEKAFLHDILSVLSIAGYPEGNPESLSFVSLYQKVESLALPVLCRRD
jgi:hypothetical protein